MGDIYASHHRDPSIVPVQIVDGVNQNGKSRIAYGVASVVAASQVNGDKVFIGRIPSHAVLLPQSQIITEALTGATDCDIGDANGPNALVDGQTFAAAAVIDPLSAVPFGDLANRLWQLLGYAEDPRKELELFITFNTKSTVDGDICVALQYAVE